MNYTDPGNPTRAEEVHYMRQELADYGVHVEPAEEGMCDMLSFHRAKNGIFSSEFCRMVDDSVIHKMLKESPELQREFKEWGE